MNEDEIKESKNEFILLKDKAVVLKIKKKNYECIPNFCYSFLILGLLTR